MISLHMYYVCECESVLVCLMAQWCKSQMFDSSIVFYYVKDPKLWSNRGYHQQTVNSAAAVIDAVSIVVLSNFMQEGSQKIKQSAIHTHTHTKCCLPHAKVPIIRTVSMKIYIYIYTRRSVDWSVRLSSSQMLTTKPYTISIIIIIQHAVYVGI